MIVGKNERHCANSLVLRKIFRKTNFSYALKNTSKCAYQEVKFKKYSFLRKFGARTPLTI